MVIASAPRRCAGAEIVQRLIGHGRHCAIHQRHVDMLALAGAVPLMQRRKDAADRIEPGEQVGDRHTRALWLAVGIAGDRHEAGHALNDVVVPGAVRIGAVLPEPGDGTVDQAGIHRAERCVVHAVFRQPTDLEVLDQDIGIGDEFAHPRLPVGTGQIHHLRGLAPVTRMEIGGRCIALPFDERRAPPAGVIALRCLDLENLGTQIGQRLTGPRAGQNARQFDDLDPFEGTARCRCHQSSLASRIAENSS